MATPEALGRRIRTVGELGGLVKTMKALAAVNIRQLERAVDALGDTTRAVELGLQALLRRAPEVRLGARRASAGQLGAVVFGSDQGMCGALNEQVAAAAEEATRTAPDATLLVVGQRVADRLADRGLRARETFAVPASTAGITDRVQDLLLAAESLHHDAGVDRVLLVHAEHRSRASYEPVVRTLLPIDRAWLEALARRPWPTNQLPMLGLPPAQLFSALVRQRLFVALFAALAESMASENASRLAAMRGAERNIADQLDALTQAYNQQRQTAITEELLDIAAGYEALQEKTS